MITHTTGTLPAGTLGLHVSKFSAVVWQIRLDDVLYNMYVHNSDTFSSSTLAVAKKMRLGSAVSRMALLRIAPTLAGISVYRTVYIPEAKSVKVVRRYLKLDSITQFFVEQFKSLQYRPSSWEDRGLSNRLGQVAEHCGVTAQLSNLWQLAQQLSQGDGTQTEERERARKAQQEETRSNTN